MTAPRLCPCPHCPLLFLQTGTMARRCSWTGCAASARSWSTTRSRATGTALTSPLPPALHCCPRGSQGRNSNLKNKKPPPNPPPGGCSSVATAELGVSCCFPPPRLPLPQQHSRPPCCGVGGVPEAWQGAPQMLEHLCPEPQGGILPAASSCCCFPLAFLPCPSQERWHLGMAEPQLRPPPG